MINPLLLESIKVRNGIPENVFLHQQRVDSSIGRGKLNLSATLQKLDKGKASIEKARILYSGDGCVMECSASPYTPLLPEYLGLVECSSIDYSLKYADRRPLLEAKGKCPDADEIIITTNGYLTDTTYSNIAFWDGEAWITPSHYLLAGTKRADLLSKGMLKEQALTVNDLDNFSLCSLINAMLDLGEVTIPITNIRTELNA